MSSARTLSLAAAALCLAAACSTSGHQSGAPTTTAVPANQFKVLLDAGTHLLRQGNSNAAEQLFQQAIQKDPHSPLGYYDLGVVYQKSGESANALHEYQLALGVNSSYVPALYNEAVLVAPGDPQKATTLYHQVIQLQPDSPTALLNLGLLDAAAHNDSQALPLLRRAVQLDPSLASSVPAPLRTHIVAP